DVDLRQRIEGDAGIVMAFRAGKADRRDAHRPDGIDEDIETCSLDQPAGMSDERKAHLVAVDARRRRVGMLVGDPLRPGRTFAFAELPAQHLVQAPRRRAVAVEKALAVEVIGNRAVIGLHPGNPDRRHADESGGTGHISKEAAAGDRHGAECNPKNREGLYGATRPAGNSDTRSKSRQGNLEAVANTYVPY